MKVLAAGLPRGTGPYRVVTSQALFGFDAESKRMVLLGVQRGLAADEAIRGMGFAPLVAEKVEPLEPPTAEELAILRQEIDPGRIIIGRPGE
jgi:glutaconate CoA-transferase subunit B